MALPEEALRAPFLRRLDNPAVNAWLDVTLADGNLGRTVIQPAADRAALLKAPAAVEPQADIDRCFDEVIGSETGALHAECVAQPVRTSRLDEYLCSDRDKVRSEVAESLKVKHSARCHPVTGVATIVCATTASSEAIF